MTHLSDRAINSLVERETHARGGQLDLATAITWLEDLGIPEHRARLGITEAIDHGRLEVVDSADGRPTLITPTKDISTS